MKKKSVITVLSLLVFLGCIAFLYRNSEDEQRDLFQIPTNSDDLLKDSREGYNSVEIYKQGSLLVINAKSEAGFFDGAQFTVETQGEIKPEDIEIIWTTIGGRTESTVIMILLLQK